MTDTRTHLINDINQNISKDDISRNVMGILLRDIRSLIELDKSKDSFKTLDFYCNWASHPNIDRNNMLYTILEKINIGFTEIVIENSTSGKKYDDYVDVVIDALDFRNLEENIKRFFNDYLSFEKIGQKRMIIPICENIIQKKIHYPENNIKENKKKKDTILRTNKISEYLNKMEKHINPKLDANIDYSNSVIIKSLIIVAIENNEIFFELEIDSDKKIKINGSIMIK